MEAYLTKCQPLNRKNGFSHVISDKDQSFRSKYGKIIIKNKCFLFIIEELPKFFKIFKNLNNLNSSLLSYHKEIKGYLDI